MKGVILILLCMLVASCRMRPVSSGLEENLVASGKQSGRIVPGTCPL